jgi:hypothetical protein
MMSMHRNSGGVPQRQRTELNEALKLGSMVDDRLIHTTQTTR